MQKTEATQTTNHAHWAGLDSQHLPANKATITGRKCEHNYAKHNRYRNAYNLEQNEHNVDITN